MLRSCMLWCTEGWHGACLISWPTKFLTVLTWKKDQTRTRCILTLLPPFRLNGCSATLLCWCLKLQLIQLISFITWPSTDVWFLTLRIFTRVCVASCWLLGWLSVEMPFCSLWPKLEPWSSSWEGAYKWSRAEKRGGGIITFKRKLFGLEVQETMDLSVLLLLPPSSSSPLGGEGIGHPQRINASNLSPTTAGWMENGASSIRVFRGRKSIFLIEELTAATDVGWWPSLTQFLPLSGLESSQVRKWG